MPKLSLSQPQQPGSPPSPEALPKSLVLRSTAQDVKGDCIRVLEANAAVEGDEVLTGDRKLDDQHRVGGRRPSSPQRVMFAILPLSKRDTWKLAASSAFDAK
jgi:hypothetical protein